MRGRVAPPSGLRPCRAAHGGAARSHAAVVLASLTVIVRLSREATVRSRPRPVGGYAADRPAARRRASVLVAVEGRPRLSARQPSIDAGANAASAASSTSIASCGAISTRRIVQGDRVRRCHRAAQDTQGLLAWPPARHLRVARPCQRPGREILAARRSFGPPRARATRTCCPQRPARAQPSPMLATRPLMKSRVNNRELMQCRRSGRTGSAPCLHAPITGT